MAIRNPHTHELNSINERIRNRQDIWSIVNDQLFWLLNNNPNKNIIVDWGLAIQLWNMPNILDIEQDITNLIWQFPFTAITWSIHNSVISTTRLWNANFVQQELSLTNWYINNLNNKISQETNNMNSQPQNQRQAYKTTYIVPLENERNQHQTNKVLLEQLLPLRQVWDMFENVIGPQNSTDRNTRIWELKLINNVVNRIYRINQTNFIPKLPNIPNVDFWQNFNITSGWNISNNIALDAVFTPNWLTNLWNTYNISYDICSEETWEVILKQNNWLKVTTLWWQEVTLKWVNINNNILEWQNITIDPVNGLTFPVNFKLAVRWRINDANTWINIDHYKPFDIIINAPKISQNDRELNYNNYNNNNSIDNRISTEYQNNHEKWENEVIRNILRSNGNEEEVNKIYDNPILRDELIIRLRANNNIQFPIMNIQNLINGFKNSMTSEARDVPLEFLVSSNAFTDYLRNNIAKNVEDFLKKEVKDNINNNANQPFRNDILTVFTDFQTNIANALWDDPSVRTNAEYTLNSIRSNSKRRRDNYMRFLIGRSETLQNQSLELSDMNHSYSINLSCETMNKLVANIEVDGQKIALAWRNLNELLKSIVSSGKISSNKLAVHIAFGVVKTMIKMIKANNINMDVRNGNGNLVETRMIDDKLSINEVDDTWRIVSKIFDEDHFKNLKDFNTLDIALGQLTKDFHQNMHYYNQDYKRATQYTRVNTLMKFDPRGTRWLRRIRKMWNWRKRNTLDFEFPSTTVTVWEKTANISFEKGKFTVSMWDKEYATTNIGRLMKKHREFDGMQMEIMSAVNSKFVDMLRANARIEKTNFGAYDNKLRRLYILDASWKLNYINWPIRNPISGRTKWQWYWKIMDKNMPNSMIPVTSESEVAQFWQNPLLGGRVVKSMMRRLGWI